MQDVIVTALPKVLTLTRINASVNKVSFTVVFPTPINTVLRKTNLRDKALQSLPKPFLFKAYSKALLMPGMKSVSEQVVLLLIPNTREKYHTLQ